MKKFHEILKELRKNANLKQEDVAQYLNVKQQTYSKYEKGLSEPDYENLIKLAELFKVSVDYLLGRYTEIKILENNTTCK